MYKLVYKYGTTELADRVIRVADTAWIPMDEDNVDYQQFLKDIKEGVELVDANGNVVTDFVKELP